MNNLICEYCKTEFVNIYTMTSHQKKAKYCLTIQGKINLEKNKKEFNCEYCQKNISTKQNLESHIKKCQYIQEKECFNCNYCQKILSTKQNLINHLDICDKKKDILIKEKEIELLKKEKDCIEKVNIKLNTKIEQLEKQEINYKEQLEKQENNYKEQIKDLQNKLERIGIKAIERPTTMNNITNNTLTIASFMDFNDLDKAKNMIKNNLDINHIVDGQKGLARFVKDNLLTDNEGKLTYICTDPSRHIFKYKDSTGEIKKDVEAKKLTNYILEGGIRTKSADIGNEWCKDSRGDIDMNKFNIMLEQQNKIMRLNDDNNSFKKELASITS